MQNKVNQNIKGLNLDATNYQIDEQSLTYALNANKQSQDGNSVAYTNEYSNQLCYNFERFYPGYSIVGTLPIIEQNLVIIFLASPEGKTVIGKLTNLDKDCLTLVESEEDCGCVSGTILSSTVEQNLSGVDNPQCCEFTPLITDNCPDGKCCIGLTPEYPVQAEYRIDNCETHVYFISANITPRFFTIERPLGYNQCNEEETDLTLACDRLKLFPDFCLPNVYPVSVSSGGSLKAGVYSFAIAYADENGQEITDYVDLSNPIPIFERKITEQTEYVTSQSIRLNIKHKVGLFNYFNLVVAENVNEVTNYHLVGTYRVNQTTFKDSIIYTGDYKTTMSSITPLIRRPHYNKAGIIEKQNDILMLADLLEAPKYNFQPLASQIELRWETVQMPADGKFDYSNPEIAYFFRTYQRDEVYPFGIKFRLKNGKYTDVFHIPGRVATSTDLAPVSNNDVFTEENDCIVTPTSLPTWQVYNTATQIGISTPSVPDDQEEQYSCNIPLYDGGKFAYWESTETYPCNPAVWGSLSEQPIRFHKFPDSNLSHIHRDNDAQIYPIGVRVMEKAFEALINSVQIEDPLNTYGDNLIPVSELICGYEIVRGNRVNNKSVIAKGLFYDVGEITDVKNNKKYYYPNYPYNSLQPDRYIKSTPDWYKKANRGYEDDDYGMEVHDGFVNTRLYGSQRFTFHSPDTHFQLPKIGTEIKLETLEYGQVQGHFVPVEQHPLYKFLTTADSVFASTIGTLLATQLKSDYKYTATDPGVVDQITTDLVASLTNTQNLIDLIEKVLPYTNYAYQFNSVASYSRFNNIPNAGDKRRFLDLGYYANDKILDIEDDAPLHNRFRETSVYLKTNNPFIPHFPGIVDNSRYTITERYGDDEDPGVIKDSNTRAYYGSIKRNFPNQYGQIENIRYVSTGYIVDIETENGSSKIVTKYYPAFGGDTYINKFALKRKHAFFTQNLANLPAKVNNMPMDYWLFPNLGYPTYYIGESPEDNLLDPALIASTLGVAIAAAVATMALPPTPPTNPLTVKAVLEAALIAALTPIIGQYVKKTNLDRDNQNLFYQKGRFYTASYGIPVFYVESDINVDLRHGRNDREENFYPNVGDGIPDEWLQEVNVPIRFDNFYHYNATYSAQNLSPNFPYRIKHPGLECLVYHPNRTIYSDQASTVLYGSDPWRIFKPGNTYDFPKQGGKLIDLNSGENERVYARFENTTKVYNARIVLDSTSPYLLEIGNAEMFKQKPIELSRSDLGYMGTQHKSYVKCEYGTFWVDAKRGHIYQLSSEGANEVKTDRTYNWFKTNLPFQILKDFPEVDIDNPQAHLGITMCWDERYERVFITKLDYRVRKDITGQVSYEDRKFYYQGPVGKTEVSLRDSSIFENKSWTVAYAPKDKEFISFYSFLPNFYIPLLGHFQSIINTNAGASTWNHLLSPFSYQTYYNVLYPYILEYNAATFPKASAVNSVTLIQDIQEYYNTYDYYSLGTINNKNLANFTKAIVYNREQSSGIINLIPEIFGDQRQKINYPKVTPNGIEAIISRRENLYTFNGFWNMAAQSNGQPLWSTQWPLLSTSYPIDKVPNPKAIRPIAVSYQKNKIKSDFTKVRLIQDKYSRFKFVNTLEITQANP